MSRTSHWASGPARRKNGEKRLTKEQRLERLHLSEEEFCLYHQLFLDCRSKYKYATQKQDGGWPQIKHRCKDVSILQHLSGEKNVAIPFSYQVNQVVLDIDCKNGRSLAEAIKTARSAADALPGEPLIYRSSESKGIRMICFLTKTVSRSSLHSWTVKELRNAGMTVESGICEVRICEGPDRLPFGMGSMLLDCSTFQPLEHLSLGETLQFAADHHHRFAISPPIMSTLNTEPDVTAYRSLVNVLLRSGLPVGENTNECLMALAWHYRAERHMGDDENRKYLKKWITHKHNGHSDRVNGGNIDKVFEQIDRILKNLKVVPDRGPKGRKRIGLTAAEVMLLVGYPGCFKDLGGIFSLLCYTKSNDLSKHSNLYSLIHSEGERVKDGTYKRGTVSLGSEDLPNGARKSRPFINLSKGLLRRMKVPNASNTAKFVEMAERIGIIELKRKAWHEKHIVRQFWVDFQFDPTGAALEDEFDSALWRVLCFNGIKKRFTLYQAKRIEKKMISKTRRESNVKYDMALV